MRAGLLARVGTVRTLRYPRQQCWPYARGQLSRTTRRCLRRRVCAEIFRGRAIDAVVLAAAQGGARACRQHRGGAARSPEPEFLVGSSVNAALANFSKGLSKLGMRDGINVNVIHQDNTATGRQDELLAQRAAATGKSVEELRAAALAKRGVRRIGQVDDVAALALFLCSERARHIQGTATAIDGGATVGYY